MSMEWNKHKGKRLFSIFKELCEKEYSDLIKCISIENLWWVIQAFEASSSPEIGHVVGQKLFYTVHIYSGDYCSYVSFGLTGKTTHTHVTYARHQIFDSYGKKNFKKFLNMLHEAWKQFNKGNYNYINKQNNYEQKTKK